MLNPSAGNLLHHQRTLDASSWYMVMLVSAPHIASIYVVKWLTAYAGNGKTYCIMKQLLKYKKYAVIAINEAFTPLLAINKLRALQPSAQNCCVYFNVTLLPQVRITQTYSV